MRHWLWGVFVLALLPAGSVSAVQEHARPDPIAALLTDFEGALNADGETALSRLLSPSLSDSPAALFGQIRGTGTGSARVVVRERERHPAGREQIVTADLLVIRELTGRVATYQLTLEPRSANGEDLEISALKRIAYLEGLFRLALDATHQFAVRDLRFTAPDLVLSMPSGSAFAASVEGGTTALVLHGRGRLQFTPPDPAEQDQLRIFAKRPSIDTAVDDVFIRMNPDDVEAHLSSGSLIPVKTEPSSASRAQATFDRFLPRSYSLTLGDLSPDRWSLLPPFGNLAVEFKSRRYGWLTYARSVADPEDITLFDRERSHNLSLYASAENVAHRGRFYDEDANAAYDVTRYGVDVTFDPARSWIAGRGRLRLRILSEATQSLSFRLAEPLVVSSVTSPELGRLLPLRVAGQTTMLVSLPETLKRNREITIDVSYSGHLEPQDLGAETVEPPRYLAQGHVWTDVQDEPAQAIQRPEPRFVYSSRSYWYPQALTTDYAPAAMKLTVPAEYTVVASGNQIGESTIAATRADARPQRVVDFFADRPVRYLACEIGRFVPIGSATVDVPAVALPIPDQGESSVAAGSSVTIDVLSTPRQVNANRGLVDRAAALVRYFSRLVGELPYPHLTITAVDAFLPGGHSPAYFALVQQPLASSPYAWRQDPLAFDDYPDYLIAHEIAHQWWGQAVGFKNYHDQWLSEGLAQYGALMFLAGGRPDVERDLVVKMRESAESLNDKGPIYLGYRLGHIEGRGTAFRAVIYNKSAVVLHMLRRFIGGEAFDRGLRRFYREWRFRKAGTDDLRAAFEAEAGRPLGRFFDRWILSSTLPRLRVQSEVDEPAAVATVRVEQLGEVFDLPLTVRLQYTDGRIEEVPLRLSERTVSERIPLNGRLRRIIAKDELTMAEWVN